MKRLDDLRKQVLAVFERHLAEVVAIEIEKIEGQKLDGFLLRHFGDGVRVSGVDAGLDELEVGDSVIVEGDDFAVEDGFGGVEVVGDYLKFGILALTAVVVTRV